MATRSACDRRAVGTDRPVGARDRLIRRVAAGPTAADPDWRWAGHTDSAYARAAVRDRGPRTVHHVLDEIDRVGWLDSHCSCTLRQAGATWFGFGAAGLIEALENWTDRYAAWGGAAHHTEELAAAGQTDEGGIWVLEADIDAGGRAG